MPSCFQYSTRLHAAWLEPALEAKAPFLESRQAYEKRRLHDLRAHGELKSRHEKVCKAGGFAGDVPPWWRWALWCSPMYYAQKVLYWDLAELFVKGEYRMIVLLWTAVKFVFSPKQSPFWPFQRITPPFKSSECYPPFQEGFFLTEQRKVGDSAAMR